MPWISRKKADELEDQLFHLKRKVQELENRVEHAGRVEDKLNREIGQEKRKTAYWIEELQNEIGPLAEASTTDLETMHTADLFIPPHTPEAYKRTTPPAPKCPRDDVCSIVRYKLEFPDPEPEPVNLVGRPCLCTREHLFGDCNSSDRKVAISPDGLCEFCCLPDRCTPEAVAA